MTSIEDTTFLKGQVSLRIFCPCPNISRDLLIDMKTTVQYSIAALNRTYSAQNDIWTTLSCPTHALWPSALAAGQNYFRPWFRLLTRWLVLRICPGRHFAETSAWLLMASIIATLDISRSPKDQDSGTTPVLDVTTGFIRYVDDYSLAPGD